MPTKDLENMPGGESLSDISDLLSMAKDQLKIKENVLKDWFQDRDLDMDTSVLHVAGRGYTVDREYTDEEVDNLYRTIKGEKTDANLFYYEEGSTEEKEADNSPGAIRRRFVMDVIRQTNDILDDRERLEELEKDYQEERTRYVEYVTSEEHDNDRLAYRDRLLEELKIMDTSIVPPSKIAAKKREAMVIEQRYSLEYLLEPLDDPKVRDSVVDGFFSKAKSRYLMDKFSSKCDQLGLRSDLQKYLLNIEENFLEEEFHAFNNLFLFYCMRQIAYANKSTAREVKQPIQGLINLIYNKFYSTEVRDTFLEAIRKFHRKFKDYTKRFEEDNILSPNHPYRIQKDSERAAMIKLSTMKQLIEDYPESGYTMESLKEKTLEELLKMIDLHKAADDKKAEREAVVGEDHPSSEDDAGEDTKEPEREVRTLEDSLGMEDEIVGKEVEEESPEESDT